MHTQRHPPFNERPLRGKRIASVFVSYTRDDMRLARKIARLLWQSKIEVAMYNPRAPWDDPMEHMYSLAAKPTCVIWFANNRTPTRWIMPELEIAAEHGTPILKLNSIAELPALVNAIRCSDFSADVSRYFKVGDLPKADGTADSEWRLTEKLFQRQISDGDKSKFIGRLNWYARLELDTNSANAAIVLILCLGPPMLALYTLVAAIIVAFFSMAIALVLSGIAVLLLLITPLTWKVASKFTKPSSWRDHV
jgi:hypothetical protein